jgi:hypothetical protein
MSTKPLRIRYRLVRQWIQNCPVSMRLAFLAVDLALYRFIAQSLEFGTTPDGQNCEWLSRLIAIPSIDLRRASTTTDRWLR